MGFFKLQLNMLNFKRKHILLAEDLYHTCGRFYLILNWNWTYAGPGYEFSMSGNSELVTQ